MDASPFVSYLDNILFAISYASAIVHSPLPDIAFIVVKTVLINMINSYIVIVILLSKSYNPNKRSHFS